MLLVRLELLVMVLMMLTVRMVLQLMLVLLLLLLMATLMLPVGLALLVMTSRWIQLVAAGGRRDWRTRTPVAAAGGRRQLVGALVTLLRRPVLLWEVPRGRLEMTMLCPVL